MVKTAGKPKGKVTAYNCFVKSCFDQHAAKYPNEKVLFTEVSAKCGEKWKEMDKKQKAIFVKMAAADEKRYNSEMAHYNAAGGSAGAKGTLSKRGKKAAKDPNKPKRPTTAYFYFANEKREEVKAANPQWKMTEIAKELGRLWQETSAEEKRRYEKMNERDKIRYEKATFVDKSSTLEIELSNATEVLGLGAKFVTGPNGARVPRSPFAVGVYDYHRNHYYGNNYGYAGGWHNNRSQQNYRGGSAGRNYGNRSSQMNASRRGSQSDKEPKLDEKQNEADAEKKMPGMEVGAEQPHDETATGETKPAIQSSKGQLHTRNPATNTRMANTNQYQNYHVGQQHRYNNQRDYGYAGNNYYGQYSNFNPCRNISYYGNQIGGYYGNNNYRNNGYYYYDDGYNGSGYNGNNSYYRNYNNNKSRGYPNQQHQRGAQREAQGGKKKKPEAEKSEGDAATEEKAVIAAAGKEQKVGDQEEQQKAQAKGKKQHKQHRAKATKADESDGSKDHRAGKPEALQQPRGGHRVSVRRSNRRSISEGSAEGEEKVRGCEGGKVSNAEGVKKSSAGSGKKEQRGQTSNSIGSKPPTALQEYRKSIAQALLSEAKHGGYNGKQKEVVNNGSADAVIGENKAVQDSSTPIKLNEPPQIVVSASKLAVVTRDDDKAQSGKVAPLSIGESLAGIGSNFGLRAVTPTDAKPARSPKPSPRSKPAPPVPEKTQKKKVVLEFVPRRGDPKEVKVTGSFNHWHSGVKLQKKSLFSGELELPLGKHEVKFVVDGDLVLSDKLPKRKVEGHEYEVNVLEVI